MLLKTHWRSISYVYKKSVIIFMHKFYFHSLSFLPEGLFSKKLASRSSRAVDQMIIPRPRSGLGGHSLYRGPVIWNFKKKIINFPGSVLLNSFKNSVKKNQSWHVGLKFFKQRIIRCYNEIKGFLSIVNIFLDSFWN